mmetsp:Transcript_79884/g.191837  ORF Transcript_79884/g.191837 Transcript_79884/m.191837 type:complete len:224 (-) Transcript_79884:1608-2279(-)
MEHRQGVACGAGPQGVGEDRRLRRRRLGVGQGLGRLLLRQLQIQQRPRLRSVQPLHGVAASEPAGVVGLHDLPGDLLFQRQVLYELAGVREGEGVGRPAHLVGPSGDHCGVVLRRQAVGGLDAALHGDLHRDGGGAPEARGGLHLVAHHGPAHRDVLLELVAALQVGDVDGGPAQKLVLLQRVQLVGEQRAHGLVPVVDAEHEAVQLEGGRQGHVEDLVPLRA